MRMFGKIERIKYTSKASKISGIIEGLVTDIITRKPVYTRIDVKTDGSICHLYCNPSDKLNHLKGQKISFYAAKVSKFKGFSLPAYSYKMGSIRGTVLETQATEPKKIIGQYNKRTKRNPLVRLTK